MRFENPITEINTTQNKENDTKIKLIEIFELFWDNWMWVLFSIVLSLFLAFVYLRYTKNQYEVYSTIFISDKDSGGLVSELSAFEDLGVLSNSTKNSVSNETGILKSRTLMETVIRNLNCNITYYSTGKVSNNELYGKRVPIKVGFNIKDSIFYNLDTILNITRTSKTQFTLNSIDDEFVQNWDFGKNIKIDIGEINVTLSNTQDLEIDEAVIVKITPLKYVANIYRERLKIEYKSQISSLLTLRLIDVSKEKAQDILNNLVFQYNEDAIMYKIMISKNTDKFINDRILDINIDLTNVDKGVEEFKTKNKLTNLEYEAGLVLDSNTEVQKTIIDLTSQLKLVDFVIDYLNDNEETLIPANLGIKDETTSLNTNNYNRLLLERNRIIKGSSRLNPTVINLDAQIYTLRKSIEQSLSNLKSSLTFSLNEARSQKYQLNKRRELAPQQEREYQDIRRKQQIIETLYLYLLQKREENAISLGIPVPNAKIIDMADGSDLPIFPKKKLVYLLAGFFGLIIPYILISIGSLLDNKIHNSEDVELIVKAPIIGEIPRNKFKNKMILADRNNSVISESFRMLRTNLNFMLTGIENSTKTIFITSTTFGEGKTVIAINLALTLSLLNKKVLLIGADIRKPKLASYLGLNPKKGLTNFLTDKNLNIEEVIEHYEDKNFDILFSGVTPPNPSELLLNGRFEDVLSYGKEHYDYIIIDTSPMSLVTDTLLLGSYADLFIYVIRAEYLDKRLLKVVQRIYENRRLPNMSILINATEDGNKSYGYGYVDNKKSWRKGFFRN